VDTPKAECFALSLSTHLCHQPRVFMSRHTSPLPPRLHTRSAMRPPSPQLPRPRPHSHLTQYCQLSQEGSPRHRRYGCGSASPAMSTKDGCPVCIAAIGLKAMAALQLAQPSLGKMAV